MTADQMHHIVSKNLAKNVLFLRELNANGYFNVNEKTNLVRLPATRAFAQKLGVGLPTGRISPHNGRPLGSYEIGVQNYLEILVGKNPDFAKLKDPIDFEFFRVQVTAFLEKTGFRREGFAREYLCIDGVWQDHLLYARLKHDPSP